MSEPYATTVVAVGPVILLVSAVELHQIVKRIATWWQEGERRYVDAEAAMAAAGSQEAVARARTLADAAPQYRRATPLMLLYAAWLGMTGLLVSCISDALAWLATYGGVKNAPEDPDTARFCYWVLAYGLIWVVFVPVTAQGSYITMSYRRRRLSRASIERLQAEAEARFDGEDRNTSGAPSPAP